ncbi:basic salivary proline-rich protein 4-like [Neopsephotus bourkii]|uniref:basic salivary proline-rich protein 4-like n=1 Tax=Neopsephotus bourkii TaxID=309878 RepID=UPI002AA5749F|nr:basic salivary proline-rich protein 4-like [Neopsephotus bourkii]
MQSGAEELPTDPIPKQHLDSPPSRVGSRSQAEEVPLPAAALGPPRGCPAAGQVRPPVPVTSETLPPWLGRARARLPLRRGCPGEGAQPGVPQSRSQRGSGAASGAAPARSGCRDWDTRLRALGQTPARGPGGRHGTDPPRGDYRRSQAPVNEASGLPSSAPSHSPPPPSSGCRREGADGPVPPEYPSAPLPLSALPQTVLAAPLLLPPPQDRIPLRAALPHPRRLQKR